MNSSFASPKLSAETGTTTPSPQPTVTPSQPSPPAKPKSLLSTIFIVLLLVALGYLGYQNWQLQQQVNRFNEIIKVDNTPYNFSSPTPPPATDQTTNWQTYTNTKHGFSFNYPVDVFVYQGNLQTYAQYWSNKKEGGPLGVGQDVIWLNMSFSDPGVPMIDFYNRIISLKPNETIPESAVTKLSDINTNNTKGAVYHQGIPPKFAGEPAYTYEAVWVKQSLVYRLSLSAFTDQNLQKYKVVFDQILSTFEFTN